MKNLFVLALALVCLLVPGADASAQCPRDRGGRLVGPGGSHPVRTAIFGRPTVVQSRSVVAAPSACGPNSVVQVVGQYPQVLRQSCPGGNCPVPTRVK